MMFAVSRFPKPEFTTGYELPAMQIESYWFDWSLLRVGLLLLFLLATAWLLYRRRSRKGLLLVAAANLAVFGFFYYGCVCPVGLVQNVGAAWFDASRYLPMPFLLLFLLPIAFAFYAGRVFCMGGCPLGAVQELLFRRKARVPKMLEFCLRLLPFLVLALAVSLAAADMGYLVCYFDPFVVIFRRAGDWPKVALLIAVLVTNLFIARSFCRYWCPYGVLLSLASFWSSRSVKIAKDRCINCNLCQNVCPVEAIEQPLALKYGEDPAAGVRKLGLWICLLPLAGAAVAVSGAALGDKVTDYSRPAELVQMLKQQADTPEVRAFQQNGGTMLDAEKALWQARSANRGIFGIVFGVTGLLAGFRILWSLRRRKTNEYTVNVYDCVGCGRCYEACPVNRLPAASEDQNNAT